MKRAALYCIFGVFFVTSSFALTPVERKLVLSIQSEVRQAQADYAKVQADLRQADANAADAYNRAVAAETQTAQTQSALGTLQKAINDAAAYTAGLAKQVTKMKPVYDQCTSHWGLGAIAYGVGELAKHLLIAVAVIAVLGVGLYVASFFFPWIGVALGVVGRVIADGFRAIGRALKSLGNLIPKPKPSPPPPAPPPPAPPVPPA